MTSHTCVKGDVYAGNFVHGVVRCWWWLGTGHPLRERHVGLCCVACDFEIQSYRIHTCYVRLFTTHIHVLYRMVTTMYISLYALRIDTYNTRHHSTHSIAHSYLGTVYCLTGICSDIRSRKSYFRCIVVSIRKK